ncbi:TRAP transporter substrate-binding protein DctP [Chloroflexota bacterium]
MKAKHIFVVVLVVFLVCGVPLTACAPQGGTSDDSGTQPASGEVIRWRMYQNSGSLEISELSERTWRWPANYLALAEELGRASNGRIEMEVMTPAGLGFTGTDVMRALEDNLVEVAEIGWGYYSGELPWLGINELPFLVRDPYVEHRMVMDVFEPYLQDAADDYDFTLYFLSRQHALPYLAIYSKVPIDSIDDLQGLKLRIYDQYHAGFIEEAGATGVFMPFSEVPMAIEQGVVDGAITSCGLVSLMGIHESGIKYQTCMFPGMTTSGFAVGNKALEALPQDLQGVVADVMGWFEDMNIAHVYNPVFAWEMMAADRALGNEITFPQSPFVDTLEEYAKVSSWQDYLDDAGPMGQEILDACMAKLGRS